MKNWTLLGCCGVDSGQLMITDPCYIDSFMQSEYKDKRVFLHKLSGRKYKYGVDFQRFDEPLINGKDMNNLLKDGEVEEQHEGLKNDYSYEGACDTTLYSKHGGGTLVNAIGAEMGVVFRSGYGDGVYPVYARHNKEGRIVEIKIKFD